MKRETVTHAEACMDGATPDTLPCPQLRLCLPVLQPSALTENHERRSPDSQSGARRSALRSGLDAAYGGHVEPLVAEYWAKLLMPKAGLSFQQAHQIDRTVESSQGEDVECFALRFRFDERATVTCALQVLGVRDE